MVVALVVEESVGVAAHERLHIQAPDKVARAAQPGLVEVRLRSAEHAVESAVRVAQRLVAWAARR